eukprot:g2088.t1
MGREGDRPWALVGAQAILCTLAFLALLALNFKIWRQYFFLILWSFVLSHAFKSTLDALQDWAEHVASRVRPAPRKYLICALCAGILRKEQGSGSQRKGGASGGAGTSTDPLYFAYKHSLMVLLGILPVLLLIVAAGGMRVANCISCCCGDQTHSINIPTTVRDRKLVNPCGSKLLILFTIMYSVALGNIMFFHSLFDVADLGAMVYKAGPSFNFTEADIRETINSVLEPPLESARESYANQTWWPVVEVAWDGVKSGAPPHEILENVNQTAAKIYGNEGWWASAESGVGRVHGWMVPDSGDEILRVGTASSGLVGEPLQLESASVKGDIFDGGGDGECVNGERREGVSDSNGKCAASLQGNDPNAATANPSSSYLSLFDSAKVWEPIRESYKWMSNHDATIASWANVTGGVLSGALGLLKRVALLVGGMLGILATMLLFFLFLDTMLTNQVDELLIVVLLLYPVTSWRSPSGRDRIQRITNDLRKAFEGILFVPLSLSSLYASHQLVSLTVLGLPGAGLACTLTFFLSLTQLLSVAVGFVVALPWIIALAVAGQFYTMGALLAFHLWGLLNVEKLVMSANRRLNRVKSPYLTAFALYLGWSVFGLQGLLVGPLGLSIMQVLYESMAEELGHLRTVALYVASSSHRPIHHKAEAAEDGVNRCRSDDVALCNTLRLADASDPERDVHRVEGARGFVVAMVLGF